MAHELIYTSAPRGLKPGSYGYCTVAATAGMSSALAARLEAMSGYRFAFPSHDPKASLNPVNHACSTLTLGGLRWIALSRIISAGFDHTQRSNLLAHHVVLDASELNPDGPAWLAIQPGFFQSEWTGEPGWIDAPKVVDVPERPSRPATAWQALAGNAGWAALLAEFTLSNPNAPVALLFNPGTDLLPLIDEALALIPPGSRWQIGYSTYLTDLLPGTACAWRCMLPDAPGLADVKRNRQSLVLDFTVRGRCNALWNGAPILDLQSWLATASDRGARCVGCAESGVDAWPVPSTDGHSPIADATSAPTQTDSPVQAADNTTSFELEDRPAKARARTTTDHEFAAAAANFSTGERTEFSSTPTMRSPLLFWGAAAVIVAGVGIGTWQIVARNSKTKIALIPDALEQPKTRAENSSAPTRGTSELKKPHVSSVAAGAERTGAPTNPNTHAGTEPGDPFGKQFNVKADRVAIDAPKPPDAPLAARPTELALENGSEHTFAGEIATLKNVPPDFILFETRAQNTLEAVTQLITLDGDVCLQWNVAKNGGTIRVPGPIKDEVINRLVQATANKSIDVQMTDGATGALKLTKTAGPSRVVEVKLIADSPLTPHALGTDFDIKVAAEFDKQFKIVSHGSENGSHLIEFGLLPMPIDNIQELGVPGFATPECVAVIWANANRFAVVRVTKNATQLIEACVKNNVFEIHKNGARIGYLKLSGLN